MKKFFSLSALAFTLLAPLLAIGQMPDLPVIGPGDSTSESQYNRKGKIQFVKATETDFRGPKYSDGISIGENEVYRLCIVRTTETPPGVEIDAAGQLVLNGATAAAWLPMTCKSGSVDYITTDSDGLPSNCSTINDGYALFYVNYDATDFSFEGNPAGKDYLYLVALDTRKGTGACEGSSTHVARYAMTLCPDVWADDKDIDFDAFAGYHDWTVNNWDGLSTYLGTINWPGVDSGWKDAAAITSLTVTQKDLETQEEKTVTLTDEALTAYLTPSIAGIAQGVDDADAPCLELTANLTDGASDVIYYTLYTKASLTDPEWISFADFVEKSEKTVDKSNGKQYTRFRIDGKSPLKIPLIDGEATRFYMLRGE